MDVAFQYVPSAEKIADLLTKVTEVHVMKAQAHNLPGPECAGFGCNSSKVNRYTQVIAFTFRHHGINDIFFF